jgi:hypothetical protein
MRVQRLIEAMPGACGARVASIAAYWSGGFALLDCGDERAYAFVSSPMDTGWISSQPVIAAGAWATTRIASPSRNRTTQQQGGRLARRLHTP